MIELFLNFAAVLVLQLCGWWTVVEGLTVISSPTTAATQNKDARFLPPQQQQQHLINNTAEEAIGRKFPASATLKQHVQQDGELTEVDSNANIINLFHKQQQQDEWPEPKNATVSDNRMRRLIPFMTFYIPTGTNQYYGGQQPKSGPLQTTKLQQQAHQPQQQQSQSSLPQRFNSKNVGQQFSVRI